MDGKERAQRFLLARTGLNQNGEEGKMLVYRRTGVPSSALVAYENPESTRALNVGYVQRLADHYGVNAAWLLGQSESWSLERDLRQACDLTGLSPDAIESLQEMTKDENQRRCINVMLSSGEFARIVRLMAGLKQTHPPEDGTSADSVDYVGMLSRFDGEGDYGFSEGDYTDLRLWQAGREMEKLIRSILTE